MERVRVRSSSIVSAGYTPELSTLELEYCNGSLYEYFAVPKDVFDSLLTAESRGRSSPSIFGDGIRSAGWIAETDWSTGRELDLRVSATVVWCGVLMVADRAPREPAGDLAGDRQADSDEGVVEVPLRPRW
jgi:hypothetical protein